MINNATQLKAKVRNLSKGDDKIAKACVIGLAEALELDSTISLIASIPCGYMAERESATADWTIIKE